MALLQRRVAAAAAAAAQASASSFSTTIAACSSSLPRVLLEGQLQHHTRQPAEPTRAAAARRHHSTTTAAEAGVAELQHALLDAALTHVKQHGWTARSLAAGARDLGLSPAAAGLLPRGPAQLVEHFLRASNAALAAELQEGQQQYLALPVRQRVTAAVRRRLEMNAAHMDSWPQALALLAQPANSPAALALLAELLDTIWYAAGDSATDGSWYAKRAGLGAVYAATELFMLTDYSPGYIDTWQQLERRVDDVLWLGSAAQHMKALPQQLLRLIAQRHQQQQQQHAPRPAGAQDAGAEPSPAAASPAAAAGAAADTAAGPSLPRPGQA